MMNTIFLLAIIAGIGFWWMYQFKKRNDLYKNIPGPRGFPVLGNSIQLKSTAKLLNILLYYSKQCGGIVKFQVGPIRRFIVVSDYKLLEFILSSTKLVNKSADYKFFHPWLGTGLLTSDGPKWKKHRRILTPGFHFLILGQFIEVFERCGNKLVEKLEKEVSKDSVNIYPFITLCALDIICESIMGTNIDAQNDENSVYVRSVKDMCRIVIQRTVSPLQMFDLLFPFTKNYYTQRKALSVLHTHTNNVITRRRQEMENTKREEVSKQKNRLTENKKVFLDLLLQSTVDGRKLSQQEIREEVDTFMFEGHDTIGSAVSFSLFCLANYPDVQKIAFEEQQALFGNNRNPTVTYADLQNMKYLELVIKETLRLYPSVPFYARETNEDLKYGNITLPKGDAIVIFAFGIHRNPDYFENPEDFNPSRFANIDGKFPYAYIPFSAGPRNCIGQKFAVLEMKSTIAKILRKFELLPAVPRHTLKLSAESVLKSSNGVKISLKLRC